ncbi:hypothetical protein MUB16_07655 [Priestia sp. OVL9]|nr:hypothetical protein [Priestia sp. OVL9]
MKKPKSNQPQQQYMQNPYMSPNYPYYMPQPQQPQPGGQQVQGQSQGGPPLPLLEAVVPRKTQINCPLKNHILKIFYV